MLHYFFLISSYHIMICINFSGFILIFPTVRAVCVFHHIYEIRKKCWILICYIVYVHKYSNFCFANTIFRKKKSNIFCLSYIIYFTSENNLKFSICIFFMAKIYRLMKGYLSFLQKRIKESEVLLSWILYNINYELSVSWKRMWS